MARTLEGVPPARPRPQDDPPRPDDARVWLDDGPVRPDGPARPDDGPAGTGRTRDGLTRGAAPDGRSAAGWPAPRPGDPAAAGGRAGAASGGARRARGGAAVALLGVAGIVTALVAGRSPSVGDAVRDAVVPRPDAALVLPDEPAPRDRDEVAAALAAARSADVEALSRSAQRTWRQALTTLPVAPGPQPPGRVDAVVDAGNGRWLGVQWRAAADLGPNAEWSLTAQVERRAPSPAVDACGPAGWGLPGGQVLRCDVASPRAGVREVRAEAVPGAGRPHPVESAGTASTPPDGDPVATVGYHRVVEVRDGTRWVQLRLARQLPGTAPPPLAEAALAALAADAGWHAG